MANASDKVRRNLEEWYGSQKDFEMMSAQILAMEGYSSVDPIHPLGGRDGGKDALAWKNDQLWGMAVAFWRSRQSFSEIRRKFVHDHDGIQKNNVQGMVFVTNQHITAQQRIQLQDLTSIEVDILHLERLVML